jgi:hypothetical protein
MRICPLAFTSVNDLCLFLQESGLGSFLLLGKQNILIARFSDECYTLAAKKFKAVTVDTPEVWHLLRIYFEEPLLFSIR